EYLCRGPMDVAERHFPDPAPREVQVEIRLFPLDQTGRRRCAEALEDAFLDLVSDLPRVRVRISPQALHKILIREALVEGHKADQTRLRELVVTRLVRTPSFGLARKILRKHGRVEN